MKSHPKPKPNEVEAWTVAIGDIPLPPFVPKATKEALKFISNLDGFYGFHLLPPKGTLCLFDSENNAKRAKNLMEAEGIRTGRNICRVFVEKKYLKGGEK